MDDFLDRELSKPIEEIDIDKLNKYFDECSDFADIKMTQKESKQRFELILKMCNRDYIKIPFYRKKWFKIVILMLILLCIITITILYNYR